MPVRGWTGFSRRWWAGEQVAPQPVEVVDVGSDETDGASLQGVAVRVLPGGGVNAIVFLAAPDRDLFVEQVVSDSTQGLLLVVEDGAGVGNFGQTLRNPFRQFIIAATLAPDGTEMLDPRSIIEWERPGCLVPTGKRLKVVNPQAGTNTNFALYFREAA